MEEENQIEYTPHDDEYWLSYIGEPHIEISISPYLSDENHIDLRGYYQHRASVF